MFRDLREFFDAALHLPIGGKTYDIPAAQMSQALRLRHSVVAGMSEAAELAEIAELLGPVAEEMAADGVLWTEYLHAGRTALLWVGTNGDIAEQHWRLGQLGELVDLDRLTALIAQSDTETPATAQTPPATKRAPRTRAPRKAAAANGRKAG